MKAYRIDQYGTIDGLRLAERPTPEPGRGQLLVRVRACSLNYRDLLVVRGSYRNKLPPGLVPVSDGAGVVIAIGPEVTRFGVGDRVMGTFHDGWPDGALTAAIGRTDRGGGIDGMLAEEVLLSETGAVRIPDDLSFAEAATLPCAAVTAWHALLPFARALPGETVVTQGTGGVSVFALQFARLLGLRAIATSSSDAKLDRVRALGAAAVINYRSTPEWQDEVLRLTGGSGADIVVEVGGPGTFARSMAAAAPGGRIAVIGLLSGPGEPVDPLTILRRRLRLQGILVGSTAMFEAMTRAIVAGGIRPVIDRAFPFEAAADAYRHLESGSHFGKVVITTGD